MDLMVDIETLDTATTAVVTQIAIVGFESDPERTLVTQELFNSAVNLEEQLKAGRTISNKTVEWWLDTDAGLFGENLFKSCQAGRLSYLPSALRHACNYVDFKTDNVWMQGPHFDQCILEALFKSVGEFEQLPWKYWQVSDVRTIEKECKFKLWDKQRVEAIIRDSSTQKHNALSDCYKQIRVLRACKAHMRGLSYAKSGECSKEGS